MDARIFRPWQGRSLKIRATVYVLVIFILGLLAMGLYGGLRMREDLKSLLSEQQLSMASFMALDINDHLKNRFMALELVAKKIDSSLLRDSETLQELLRQQYPLFLSEFNGGVMVTRFDGTALAFMPATLGRVGVNLSDADHIAGAINQGEPTISKSGLGMKELAPVISMAVPIRDSRGIVIGALAGITDLVQSNFLKEIVLNRYAKSGGYVVIDTKNRLIVTSSQFGDIMEELPTAGISPEIDSFISGGENPVIFVNSHGVRILASSASIPTANWIVAVAMPIEEAFAPVRNMAQSMSTAAIMLTLLAGFASWYFFRRQLMPVLDSTRILATMADTNRPLPPFEVTKKDEIGNLLTELNRLMESFGQRETQWLTRNKEMNKAKERAEGNDRLKSIFLTNMVHGIRNPMNSIVGFSQLMSASDLSEKERKSYADIIYSSSTRLFKTINNLLDISRIETGLAVVKRKNFQIYRLLQELHHAYVDEFKQKNIELKLNVATNLESLVMFSDESKIYHILNGLLDNAYKFTEKGQVEFGFDLVNKNIIFFVKDTGIGIPKTKQEIIFNKFFQKDISTSVGDDVSGLDLVLAKGYVNLLGGTIWFESEEGRGSLFRFSTPYVPATAAPGTHDEAPSQTVPSPISPNFDWSSKTILVAEDDMNNFLLLNTILSNRTNVKILHAHTGNEALEILKDRLEIEVILMDLKMPGMDGFTATRKIREFNKRIPIFALTAYSEQEDRKKALEAGCNEFIIKPFDMEVILRLLATKLEKRVA